jgi:S-adenosylmethionine decarboxylase
MMLKEIKLDNYLFGIGEADLSQSSHKKISRNLQREMLEIFYGRNIIKMPGG